MAVEGNPVVNVLIRVPGTNEKGEPLNNLTDMAVIARAGDFPDEEILDNKSIIHYVLSQPTYAIDNEVDAEFKDAYTEKQQILNNILFNHDIKALKHKVKNGKEPLTKEEQTIIQKYSKAEDELSDIYLEIHDTVKDRVLEKRQRLIKNPSLEDLGDIVMATKIYIGNFYFWKMVKVWDLLMYDIEKAVNAGMEQQLSQEEQLAFIEKRMKEIKRKHFDGRKVKAELLKGKKYDRKRLNTGADGGIATLMEFIEKNNSTAYSRLTNYIKWAMKTSTRQLRYTPQRNLAIYYSVLHENQGSVRVFDPSYDECHSTPIRKIAPSIKPYKATERENGAYSNILQAKATNNLQHTSKKDFLLNPITQIASVENEGVEIFIRNYNNIVLNVPTHKVLDALTIKLTNGFPHGETATAESIDKHRGVTLSVNEYMGLCGTSDRKEARKQLKTAINTLYDTSLQWEEERYILPEGKKRRVKQNIPWSTRILDTKGGDPTKDPVQNGKVIVYFAFTLAKYLSQAFPMPYPIGLLKINGNANRHSYFIGRKLAEHHNMNIGKDNSNRIAVTTLLHACPDLPIYNDVIVEGKHITQQIIQPFERDLIALKDKYNILKDWRYCNSKGEPLTNEQVESYNYSTWKQWLVEFELTDYPDQSDRLVKIEERKKKIAHKRKSQAKAK